MTFADAVPAFRAAFDAEMVDTCDIVRPTTTRGAINETTLAYDSEADTTLYADQPCLARPGYSGAGQTIDFAETEPTLHNYTVILPYDTDGVRPDDIVTLSAVSQVDGDLLGLPLTVRHTTADSFSARRVLYCTADLGAGKLT